MILRSEEAACGFHFDQSSWAQTTMVEHYGEPPAEHGSNSCALPTAIIVGVHALDYSVPMALFSPCETLASVEGELEHLCALTCFDELRAQKCCCCAHAR
jgi:hypothetical protein